MNKQSNEFVKPSMKPLLPDVLALLSYWDLHTSGGAFIINALGIGKESPACLYTAQAGSIALFFSVASCNGLKDLRDNTNEKDII